MYTYRSLLKEGEEHLNAAGIVEARADAWCLFESATGKNRTAYFMHDTDEAAAEECELFFKKIERRAKREPLQYIEGVAPFMGYSFKVTPDVLIPRFDTEVLVAEVIKLATAMKKENASVHATAMKQDASIQQKLADKQGNVAILDMCTGSGCIIISLYKELMAKGTKVTAATSDLSEAALTVAKENARALGAEITFYQGNLFENVQGKYDIIVSNPPYIKTGVIEGLEPEVRECEPMMALDGYEDGLYFYREIIKNAGAYLKNGGHIAFEIGHDQGEAVSGMLQNAGYTEVKVIKDLAGLDRVVIARKND